MPNLFRQSKINATLVNRDAVLSTLWSTLQQIVVASSTFFLLRAIQNATNANMRAAAIYIGCFVASLVLVYLPGCLSQVYLQKWRYSSVEQFLALFSAANFGKTSLGHARNKAVAESWITNESFTVFEQATSLIYQIYSTFLNSSLNILVIALALEWRILFWYMLSGIVLIASNRLFKSSLSRVSKDAQLSRKTLAGTMLRAWDNIFVGNQINFINWQSQFSKELGETSRQAARYEASRAVLSSGAMVLALFIVAIGNGLFFYQNMNSVSTVAALFVTLPRQIQIVQSIFNFYTFTLTWTGTAAQLEELEQIIEFGKESPDSVQYVTFQDIEWNSLAGSTTVADLDAAENLIRRHGAGRITVRGRNGAGKSTLLSLLKERFAEGAFLLPTRYAQLCFRRDISHQSDGNRLRDVMQEIESMPDTALVILDEWDANLDDRNMRELSQLIDEMAKTRLIIESRHRANA